MLQQYHLPLQVRYNIFILNNSDLNKLMISYILGLVGAPRILMALGQDNICNIPGLEYFSTPNKDGDPVYVYFTYILGYILVYYIEMLIYYI